MQSAPREAFEKTFGLRESYLNILNGLSKVFASSCAIFKRVNSEEKHKMGE